MGSFLSHTVLQIVGNRKFPSTTKKSNTHVHEPHFFNAYNSMRNEKESTSERTRLISPQKKGKKMTVSWAE